MADLPSFLRRPESNRNGNNEVYDDEDDNKDEFDDEVDDDDDVDVDDEEEEHFHSSNRHFRGGGGGSSSGGEQEMMSLFGRKSMDKEKGNAGDETTTITTTTAMTTRRRHQVIQLSLLTIVLFLGTLFVTLQTSGSRNHHGKASLPTRSSSHQHPHPQQHKQQGESTTTHPGPTPPTISSPPPPPPQNQKGPLPRQDRCKSHISSSNGNACYKLDLARVQDQYGIPVVLVSMDASGELEIWKQASRLINDRASVILPHEGIGRTPVEVRQHLEQRERPGECWLIDLLCHVQQKSSVTQQQGQKHGSSSSSNSGSSNSTPPVAMYGTRWKPFPPSFGFSASRAALHWIQTTMNVQRIDNEKGTNNIRGIKLIYLQRNPVDLVLERLFQQQQHITMPTKTKIPTTTTHSNDNNNKNNKNYYNYPKVHVPSDFLNQVKRITSIYQQARRVLNDIEGAYVFVQYEHLMYDRVAVVADKKNNNTSNTMMMMNQQRPTREDAWTTLIRHLHPVRGTKHLFLPLAKERIPRNELVVNYNDIVTALQGTFWEQYLHDT